MERNGHPPTPPRLVIGCNYHTTWQSHPGMRFILAEVKGDQARLQTRNSRKDFWTKTSDLIFIESSYNIKKAAKLMEAGIPIPDWVKNLKK